MILGWRAQASQTTGLIAALGEDRVRDWWSVETFVAAERAESRPSWAESVPSLLAALAAWALCRRTANLPVALFGALAVWWLVGWAATLL